MLALAQENANCLSFLLKNEVPKSSPFPDHTFYAKCVWSGATFWQDYGSFLFKWINGIPIYRLAMDVLRGVQFTDVGNLSCLRCC